MHTSSRDVSCIYISVPDPFMYINSWGVSCIYAWVRDSFIYISWWGVPFRYLWVREVCPVWTYEFVIHVPSECKTELSSEEAAASEGCIYDTYTYIYIHDTPNAIGCIICVTQRSVCLFQKFWTPRNSQHSHTVTKKFWQTEPRNSVMVLGKIVCSKNSEIFLPEIPNSHYNCNIVLFCLWRVCV